MSDAETSGRGRQAGAAGGEDAGLGVHSSVPPTLHPTAQKILAAARKILTERGYQSMTLQAISAEAQVNKAGVWYYFGGKQQLVLALLEDVTIRESLHFGTMPPEGATLAERVDLIVGTAEQIRERVSRFTAFYELLPEASRDAELHDHLRTYYQGWYDWADGSPLAGGGRPCRRRRCIDDARPVRLDPARRHHRGRWSSRPRSSTWRPRWTTRAARCCSWPATRTRLRTRPQRSP